MEHRLLSMLMAGLITVVSVHASSQPLGVDKPHSHIDVVVKATVDSFIGHLDDYEAKVVVDTEKNHIQSACLSFKFSDVKTGKDKRDEKMHEWQDTTRHPDGAFTLSSLDPAKDGRWLASGTLSFHGTTRPIAFPVTVTTDHHLYAIDGEAQIDTREYGLPVIRMMGFLKVDPLVQVRFHLQGTVN